MLPWRGSPCLQRKPSLTEDPIGIVESVMFCVLSETPLMLCIVRMTGENSWRTTFLALVMSMLSHCCQSRRSNSSKWAWWKFGSFSMHPLLPQAGRISGPGGRDGADVFSFSVALMEWFWSSTAHLERYVCACEDTRTTEGALLEESQALEASGLSVIFQAAVVTWHKHEKYKWSLPAV